jgi:O-antigen chain-terminating methyltransferase
LTRNTFAVSEHEVDMIAARLRAELGGAGEAADGQQVLGSSAARAQVERFWPVTADRPFLYKPGRWGRIRGTLLVPAKVFLRKLMRWYVEPALAQQRDFNSSALKALDELSERIDDVLASLERRSAIVEERVAAVHERLAVLEHDVPPLERHGDEIEERMLRVERRTRGEIAPSPTLARADHDLELPDYFAFEARMRGPRDVVRERQAVYVDDFRSAGPVLDLGCGRGEFLELLRDAGVEARGVDLDADMVAQCRAERLDVERADAIAYLASLEDRSLGGIFSAHVVEHLKPGVLFQLLELAAAKLRPDGLFVAETPNPLSLYALANFSSDLSHEQPLHPATLELLVRQAGFKETKLRFLGHLADADRLQRIPLPADDTFIQTREALDKDVDRLNDVVFGPQDYAVVART